MDCISDGSESVFAVFFGAEIMLESEAESMFFPEQRFLQLADSQRLCLLAPPYGDGLYLCWLWRNHPK